MNRFRRQVDFSTGFSTGAADVACRQLGYHQGFQIQTLVCPSCCRAGHFCCLTHVGPESYLKFSAYVHVYRSSGQSLQRLWIPCQRGPGRMLEGPDIPENRGQHCECALSPRCVSLATVGSSSVVRNSVPVHWFQCASISFLHDVQLACAGG